MNRKQGTTSRTSIRNPARDASDRRLTTRTLREQRSCFPIESPTLPLRIRERFAAHRKLTHGVLLHHSHRVDSVVRERSQESVAARRGDAIRRAAEFDIEVEYLCRQRPAQAKKQPNSA